MTQTLSLASACLCDHAEQLHVLVFYCGFTVSCSQHFCVCVCVTGGGLSLHVSIICDLCANKHVLPAHGIFIFFCALTSFPLCDGCFSFSTSSCLLSSSFLSSPSGSPGCQSLLVWFSQRHVLDAALPASGPGEDAPTDHAEQCQTRVHAHTNTHTHACTRSTFACMPT